ncbi:MAG: DUF1592 domain-containing protein [Acidobacteria bacterium]|nr:DUF1592 domain-containing protein [Acidobacteriota bacterium]
MLFPLLMLTAASGWSAVPAKPILAACGGCHGATKPAGGLNLASLSPNLEDKSVRERWTRVHDRVERGEMPPPGVPFAQPAKAAILRDLRRALHEADAREVARQGRGPVRRLNRDEYEQNLRDLLALPHLDVRDILPEDREAFHFNKTAEALDMSRVQLTAYMDAAEAALREAMATTPAPPEATVQRAFGARLFPGQRSTGGRESMFFLKDNQGINVERAAAVPWTRETLEDQAVEMGLFRSPGWPYGAFPQRIATKHPGLYRVRFAARAVLQHPGFRLTDASHTVPMTLRSRRPTNHDIAEDVKSVGGIFDIRPGRGVYETVVYLREGQTVEYGLLGLPVPQVDAIPSQPGSYRYPPFPAGGQPGVAFNWIELEGPLPPASWPPASHRVLFDELGIHPSPANARAEARRLLRRFMGRAARRPVPETAAAPFDQLIARRLDKGEPFVESVIAGYQAFLCSGWFLYLENPPDAHAIAGRLSHFLANTAPDTELRSLAESGRIREPAVVRAQADRLIQSPGFERFVKAFAGYWLNLRHLRRDDPDIRLYPEYRLDEYLVDSMERETLAFITTLVRENLPAASLVNANFTFVNEHLARHYGLPAMEGSRLRRVELPPSSPRGGLLTQGAILKITANGTSTSPVLRGAWIMDRIAGDPPPPPPPNVPAVEPDIRGAKTIREQLALHTRSAQCAGCHAKFDPPGFALENFDVLGRWRTRYRGVAEGERVTGIDHTGHDFAYTVAGPVDAGGTLANGKTFRNVLELKAILASDPRPLARNLMHQWIVYATGTPVRFSDRAEVERLLDQCAPAGYRVGDLLRAFVGSKIFLGGTS